MPFPQNASRVPFQRPDVLWHLQGALLETVLASACTNSNTFDGNRTAGHPGNTTLKIAINRRLSGYMWSLCVLVWDILNIKRTWMCQPRLSADAHHTARRTWRLWGAGRKSSIWIGFSPTNFRSTPGENTDRPTPRASYGGMAPCKTTPLPCFVHFLIYFQ